ncbi:MAG: acetyltransferase [Desulfobulbaceae bacterium]|nr:MAG: acetyltransferase [Desulfobulbaceae bacterium]
MVLYGAGGHAKVVMESIRSNQQNCRLIITDDNREKIADRYLGIEVIAPEELPSETGGKGLYVVTIGDNSSRNRVVSRLSNAGVSFAHVVHVRANVSTSAEIGAGTVVMPGATINSETMIGEHTIINTNASIDHDCQVSDFVHIGPGATLCGGVMVGEGSLVGAGATIIPNCRIGINVTIGAGTTIRSDIEDNMTVYTSGEVIIKK